MFGLEALDLARIQFAFTVSFHILFPAITIGLASYLMVLEGMWLKTRDDTYRDLYHFWSKIFAVNFGMGVVSGLVMAWLLDMLLPLTVMQRGQMYLFAALPPAVFCFMVAESYKQEPERVAAIVLLGNFAALAFVPLGLWLGM